MITLGSCQWAHKTISKRRKPERKNKDWCTQPTNSNSGPITPGVAISIDPVKPHPAFVVRAHLLFIIDGINHRHQGDQQKQKQKQGTVNKIKTPDDCPDNHKQGQDRGHNCIGRDDHLQVDAIVIGAAKNNSSRPLPNHQPITSTPLPR